MEYFYVVGLVIDNVERFNQWLSCGSVVSGLDRQ